MIMLMIVMITMVIFKRIPQETAKKEVLVGRRSIRCDLLESPKWVSHAWKVLKYLPSYF